MLAVSSAHSQTDPLCFKLSSNYQMKTLTAFCFVVTLSDFKAVLVNIFKSLCGDDPQRDVCNSSVALNFTEHFNIFQLLVLVLQLSHYSYQPCLQLQQADVISRTFSCIQTKEETKSEVKWDWINRLPFIRQSKTGETGFLMNGLCLSLDIYHNNFTTQYTEHLDKWFRRLLYSLLYVCPSPTLCEQSMGLWEPYFPSTTVCNI